MKALVGVLISPYFLLWLGNVKVPFAGEEVLVQFVYAYLVSVLILSILIAKDLRLLKSSLLSLALMGLLFVPTLFYQLSGLSDAVVFEHLSGFPLTAIAKWSLIFLVFVTFNELLFRNYVSPEYLFKIFVLTILLSIPIYLFKYYDLLLDLDIHENRPYPEWVGGWNTYAFLLALAFVIILRFDSIWLMVKILLLSVIFLVMLTTLSRSGLVALVVALILYGRLRGGFESQIYPRRKTILAVGATVLAAIGLAVLFGLGDVLYIRFVSTSIETQVEGVDYLQSVSSGRTVFWLDAVMKFIDVDHYYQWLFGYGVGHYGFTNNRLEIETDLGNQYLQFIYEFGFVIGIGLCLVLFRAYASIPWEGRSKWAATIKLCTSVLIVSHFFQGFVYGTQVGWLIGLGAALIMHVQRDYRRSFAR